MQLIGKKKSRFNLLVSPPEPHVPDSVKSPVILENEGIVFADVNPRNNDIEAKISLPQTKCFMVPDF